MIHGATHTTTSTTRANTQSLRKICASLTLEQQQKLADTITMFAAIRCVDYRPQRTCNTSKPMIFPLKLNPDSPQIIEWVRHIFALSNTVVTIEELDEVTRLLWNMTAYYESAKTLVDATSRIDYENFVLLVENRNHCCTKKFTEIVIEFIRTINPNFGKNNYYAYYDLSFLTFPPNENLSGAVFIGAKFNQTTLPKNLQRADFT